MSLRSFVLAFHLVLYVLRSQVTADPFSYNVSGYDIGPDWSKDPFPPYPPLTDENGNLLDAQNVRGTRLYGYTGCSSNDKSIIDATFDDFYKLTHIDGLWANFAWNEQPAKEMWGAPTKIPDERKEEIRRML